jgi:hypothetical protein
MAFQLFGGMANMWGGKGKAINASPGYQNYQGCRQGLESTPSHMKSLNAPVLADGSECNHYRNVNDGSQVDTEREDLLDQHVAYFMRHHPQVQQKHTFVRTRPGVYNFDGREIQVEWHYCEEPDQPGYLIVIDGPLRQPFADYMANNEKGICYDDKRLAKSKLEQQSKAQRLSFGDANKMYTRLEAMKVAKEQAVIREKAAEYAHGGYAVPQQELMERYKKTISQKLGERRQRPEPKKEEQMPELKMPAEAPVAVPVVAPPAPEPRAPAPPPTAHSKETHGNPKYCSRHNTSDKRKKCAPEKKACTKCHNKIQTNYAEFSLCPHCSNSDNRCMCCGAPSEGAEAKAAKGERHGNPRYCAEHNKSERRKKCAPEKKPCSNCGTSIQTNYKMFSLCPACSERDNRCMCCGSRAVNAEAPSTAMHMQSSPQNNDALNTSAPSGANLFGMPNLFGDLQGAQRMPQQNNAYATNNVFMSQNPMASGMASQNPMASQNYYVNPMTSQNGAFVSYNRRM